MFFPKNNKHSPKRNKHSPKRTQLKHNIRTLKQIMVFCIAQKQRQKDTSNATLNRPTDPPTVYLGRGGLPLGRRERRAPAAAGRGSPALRGRGQELRLRSLGFFETEREMCGFLACFFCELLFFFFFWGGALLIVLEWNILDNVCCFFMFFLF